MEVKMNTVQDFKKIIQNNIDNGIIPPYVYTYPPRSSYRDIKSYNYSIAEIWEEDKKNSASMDLNLYIHIPFCTTKCTFCNLYSIGTPNTTIIDDYINSLCDQIHSHKKIIQERALKTIYIGGGTPALLSLDHFKQIFSSIDEIYPNWRMVVEEVALEATPISIANEPLKFKELIDMGLTRINIGVQSLDESELASIGRKNHSNYDVIKEAFDILNSFGIANISTDLIIGLYGQTNESWTKSIENLLELKPDTISTYYLTVRPDAKVALSRNYEYYRDPNLYERYDSSRDTLLSRGYVHDTNIRFKKMGNGGYRQKTLQFQGIPYLGLGCGARTYTNTVDYYFGSKPSLEQINDYIANPYSPDTVVETGFVYTEDERIRKRFALNLFDLDLMQLKHLNIHEHTDIYENLLCAAEELGLVQVLSNTKYQLTADGLKYRDILSWMFFSDEVKKLDNEFYLDLHNLNVGEKKKFEALI